MNRPTVQTLSSLSMKSVTTSASKLPNLSIFEGFARQEEIDKKRLSDGSAILQSKQSEIFLQKNKMNAIERQKHMTKENLVVEQEKLHLLDHETGILTKEIKEFLKEELSLKSQIVLLNNKCSFENDERKDYQKKIEKHKEDSKSEELSTTSGIVIRKKEKTNVEYKQEIEHLKKTLAEKSNNCIKINLEEKIRKLTEEKIKLSNIYSKKLQEIKTEEKEVLKKKQERDVMWNRHQAKKRRLKSEIFRVNQLREQQKFECNKIRDEIQSFNSSM